MGASIWEVEAMCGKTRGLCCVGRGISTMGSSLSTVIVEPRSLVREALKSLLAKNLYDVVWSVGSTAELSTADLCDEPQLVVLSVQFAEEALAKAVAIRGLWPDSKIVLLYEHVCQADLEKVLESEID